MWKALSIILWVVVGILIYITAQNAEQRANYCLHHPNVWLDVNTYCKDGRVQ